MRNKLFCILLSFLFFSSLEAQDIFHDTLKIKTINVTSSQKIKNNSLQKKTIDSLKLSNTVHTDLSELLQDNTSIFVKKSIRGSNAGISLRGAVSSQTKVKWNKIPLNSPMNGNTDISLLPFFFADKVSVIHSPASVMETDGAIGGAVSLETMPQWGKGLNIIYAGSAGSFNTYDNFLKLNYSEKKFSTSTRIFHSHSDNDFIYENTDIINGGKEKRKNADFTNYGFMETLSYRPAKNQFINLSFWYQNSERGVPGLTTNESGIQNNISRQKNMNLRGIIDYNIHLENKSFNIWTAVNKEDVNFKTENYISGIGKYNSINSNSNSLSSYNGIKSKFKFKNGNILRSVFRYNFFEVNSEEQVKNLYFSAGRHDFHLSLDYEHELSENWYLKGTIKEDLINKELYKPVFSLSSSWKAGENIGIYTSFSKNTRHPTMNDLYYIPGGNPELKPERSLSGDAGINVSIRKGLKIDNQFDIYYRKTNDLILWRPTPQGYWKPDNVTAVKSAGFEISSRIRKKRKALNYCLVLSYSLNRSIDISYNSDFFKEGGQLPYIPVHSANVKPQISWKNWLLQYQFNYYSSRYTTSSNSPETLYSIYPYFMSDVHLSKSFNYKEYKFSISLSVFNVFDESYRSVLWQPMPGINYRAGIKFRFK